MKECPLLIQGDTRPSWTIPNESYTRTYMLKCTGEKCAAYKDGFCRRFDTVVNDTANAEDKS